MNPSSNPYGSPQGTPGQQMPPQGYGGVPSSAPQQFGVNSSKSHGRVGLIVTIVILTLLLIAAGAFGFWAFTEREDYKNNSDAKVAVAVDEAKKTTTEENNARFAEESKSPLKEYQGPSAFGSVKVAYPKTWSGYIDLTSSNNEPLLAKFHPNVVPALGSGDDRQAIALTISVLNQSYDRVIEQRSRTVEDGRVQATAYALPKMPDQVGLRFDGKVNQLYNGTEIILPLRDKTLVILTETDQFTEDFNKYILPNITFVP